MCRQRSSTLVFRSTLVYNVTLLFWLRSNRPVNWSRRFTVRFWVNYTRNEWRRCKITLQTGGKDVKLHSKRVENIGHHLKKFDNSAMLKVGDAMVNATIDTLQCEYIDLPHSKRVYFLIFSTRLECNYSDSPAANIFAQCPKIPLPVQPEGLKHSFRV